MRRRWRRRLSSLLRWLASQRWALVLLLAASPAWAGSYQVTFAQPANCDSIVKWELWAKRSTDAALTKRVDVLPANLAAPCSETVDNVATVSVNLKHGTYNFVLRADGDDGATADSDALAQVLPLTKPIMKQVR